MGVETPYNTTSLSDNQQTSDFSACPLCGSLKTTYLLKTDNSYALVRCRNCNVVRIHPMPSEGELSVQYHEDYYQVLKRRSYQIVGSFINDFYSWIQARMVEAFKKKERLLDVGCGDGRFLAAMESRGWAVCGIDSSKTACEISQRKLRTGAVSNKTLGEARFPDASFDVITLWHVMEHVRNPKETLLEIRRILKPGGICLISVPNIASIDFAIFQADWFHLDLPRHLYHYTPETLKRIVEAADLNVVAINTRSFGCPLSKPHSLRRWLGRKFGLSSFTGEIVFALFILLYPLFLIWNEIAAALWIGETFTIICRKSGKV